MPTKPLDRLMFAQGGLCFFCNVPLPKAEASVEHLVASTNGGSNADDNCVACCKAINSLLGSMSLKEKVRVVLNQQGKFKCPNGIGNPVLVAPVAPVAKPKVTVVAKAVSAPAKPAVVVDPVKLVITNLKSRGKALPGTVKTLTSTIKSLPQKFTDKQAEAVIQKLQSAGKVTVTGTKVTYKL